MIGLNGKDKEKYATWLVSCLVQSDSGQKPGKHLALTYFQSAAM